jgi:4-amino-4-deoxy-L-arabinose transferase-like glycosyltransferase
MTKQTEALLIPLIFFIYLVATKRNIKFLYTKRFSLILGIGFLLFSPWLIFMSIRFGSDFWQNYFVYSAVTRTISPIEGHTGSYLFYFSYLANNEIWWAILLPFAAGLCVFNSFIRRLKEDTLILTWMLIVLAIFTYAQTKLFWYILPAFPAFAIAIANLLYQLSKILFQRYPSLNPKRRLK